MDPTDFLGRSCAAGARGTGKVPRPGASGPPLLPGKRIGVPSRLAAFSLTWSRLR